MKDENCIFCKLAGGDIPTMSIYEDEDFNVIFDTGPATLGHALILPKSHAKNIFELDDELVAKAYILAKKIAAALMEVFNADGINILQNNNEEAGQTVFHFHIHLIPRYAGEEKIVSWTPGNQNEQKLSEAAEKLKEVLK